MRWFRAALISLPVLAAGVGVGYGFVYLASERYLGNVQADSPFDHPIPSDTASIEHGRHLARTRGCFGCHGQQLQGVDFSEEWPWVGVAVAPNLAHYARQHEPPVLEAAIRQGIGADGRALWSMPSYNFANLNDTDTAALIAFLQSSPVVEQELPEPRLGWAARWRIVRGQANHMAEWADRMPPPLLGAGDDPQLRRGEYLAKTSCNECHGFDLRGMEDIDFAMPDLAILAGYTDQQFRTLMARGEGIGGRTDLGLMTLVARDRFAHFSEQELSDLLAYLRTLPGQPVDRDAAWRTLR